MQVITWKIHHPQTKNVGLVFQVFQMEEVPSTRNNPSSPSCAIEAGSTSGTPHLAGLFGMGDFFFIPFQISPLGMWGALRKSWVFALKGSQKKIVKKIVVFPLPFEKKNNPTKKKQLFLEICQCPLWVFSSHSLVEKKTSTPSRPHHCPGLSGYSWERAPRNFLPRSTPHFGEKNAMETSMEAFTIGGFFFLLGMLLGGKKHVIFCNFLRCGPIKASLLQLILLENM